MPLRDTSPERVLVAIWDGDRRQLRQLLARGASTDAPDQDGRTPLMHAVFEDDPPLVTLLLEAGADVTLRDKGGWTALHCAATARSAAIVKLLLAAGADPNAKDDAGDTPLLDAVCGHPDGRRETVVLLLEHGASPTLKNAYGNSPRSVALESRDADLRSLLGAREKPKRPSARDRAVARAAARPLMRVPPIIARRTLELTNHRGTRRVEVAIARPARDGRDWVCMALITGLGPGPKRLPMYGADSMQALIHALQIAGVHLQTRAEGLRWWGRRQLGFPPVRRRKRRS